MNTLNRKLTLVMLTALVGTQVADAASWYDGIVSAAQSTSSYVTSSTSRYGAIAAGVAAVGAITYALYLKNEATKVTIKAKADEAAKVVVDTAKAVEVLKTSKTVDASPEAVAQADAILVEARKIQARSRQAMSFARTSELHKQAALKANILSGVQQGTLGL